MVGLRNPRAAAKLVEHGFTEQDLREGFTLLASLVRLQLATAAPVEDRKLLQRLEAFEKRWLGIARAALERHHPGLAEVLFANLRSSAGAHVAVSMGAFIERLDALAKPDSSYGPEAADAIALLDRRGLSPGRIAEGRALLDELAVVRAAPIHEISADEQKAAEDAMWRWYLEWSEIARSAISDRRVLRSLGFLRSQRKAESGDEEAIETPAVVAEANVVPQLPASTDAGRAA
jgi:hypothetical protein